MNHPKAKSWSQSRRSFSTARKTLEGLSKPTHLRLVFYFRRLRWVIFLQSAAHCFLPSTLERNLRRRPAVIYVKRVQSPCFTRQCFPLRNSAPCFRCSFTCWIAWNRNERCRRKKKMSCAYCLKGSISNNIVKTSLHFNNISLLKPLTKN